MPAARLSNGILVENADTFELPQQYILRHKGNETTKHTHVAIRDGILSSVHLFTSTGLPRIYRKCLGYLFYYSIEKRRDGHEKAKFGILERRKRQTLLR